MTTHHHNEEQQDKEDYTTEPLVEETTVPENKIRKHPISNGTIDWAEALFMDDLNRPMYQMWAGALPFVVKYRPGDRIINPGLPDHRPYYYEVYGYGLEVQILYDFPFDESTRKYTTSAMTRPEHTPLTYYHLSAYLRSDNTETEYNFTIPIWKVDSNPQWIPYVAGGEWDISHG
jgi:hypothetical protein